jgi:hypothetical protein
MSRAGRTISQSHRARSRPTPRSIFLTRTVLLEKPCGQWLGTTFKQNPQLLFSGDKSTAFAMPKRCEALAPRSILSWNGNGGYPRLARAEELLASDACGGIPCPASKLTLAMRYWLPSGSLAKDFTVLATQKSQYFQPNEFESLHIVSFEN